MCQSKSQGGLRCAASTKPRFDALYQSALSSGALTPDKLLELQEATSLYAATPSGAITVSKLSEPLWTTNPELAAALEIAVKIGAKNRDIASDVARIVRIEREKLGLPPEDEKPSTCLPIETAVPVVASASPKFDADAWLASHPHDGKMSNLWSVLIQEANRDGRHEARDLLRSITEEDLATYIIAEEAFDRELIAEDIADRTGMKVEDVMSHLQKASKRQSNARFTTEKLDMLSKMQKIVEEDFLEPAWVLQKVSREDSDWAAVTLKKNATKRNRFESVAAAFVRSRTGLPTLQLSQAATSLSVRFSSEGEITLSQGKSEGHSKSSDLAVVIEDGSKVRVILAGHKFGRVRGGGQDNQWNDAATYLNNALVANEKHADIPELRALVSKSVGREIAPEDFSWEPALILDGDYFSKAPTKMRMDDKRPLLNSTQAYIGDIDTFVEKYEAEKLAKANA